MVEQVGEGEIANAASFADRFGFFNDPQTGVALAATMKLAKSGDIPKNSRVVVISTAHGLKFVEFKFVSIKANSHTPIPSLRNLPINAPADLDAVRAAIDGRLPA